GDWNHGRQLGVADGRESASDGHQYKGNRDCWAGTQASAEPGRIAAVQQQVQNRCFENRLCEKMLTGGGCSGDGKNAGADHRTNAHRNQAPDTQRLAQLPARILGSRDEVVDGLGAKELAGHPQAARCGRPVRANASIGPSTSSLLSSSW